MKYAVVQIAGHQYLVKEGDSVVSEKISATVGTNVTPKVLLSFDAEAKDVQVGMPEVDSASVSLEKTGEKRDRKVMVVKFKPKVRYHKRQGHRQTKNTLRVTKVS